MQPAEAVDLLACPDCQGELSIVGVDLPEGGINVCHGCQMLFPIIDRIPVLLSRSARSHALEHPALVASVTDLGCESPEWLPHYLEKTLTCLEQCRADTSWEWEDEEYWTDEYSKQTELPDNKNWNDRFWQREFLMDHLTAQSSLRGQTLLDVGCGQGQNFRQLLFPHCDERSLYIAADMSLAGLQLNRRRNPHHNSLYILCSADRLPLAAGSVDLLCYFGILHHTERKEATMSEDSRLVRPGGHMLVHEALERPHLTPGFLKRNIIESAHEERIPREAFLNQVRSLQEMKVICSRQMHTVILGGMMKLLRWPMIHSKTFFSTVATLDVLCRRTLGEAVPFFGPGEVLLLLEKSR